MQIKTDAGLIPATLRRASVKWRNKGEGMRFLFVSAQYLPTIGGVERYTDSLARTLVAQGHEVTIITSALPGAPTQEQTDAGRIVRLPSLLLFGGRLPILRHGSALREMAEIVWDRPYDFAVINTRLYTLCLWAAKACHHRNIPAIVIEHGTQHLELSNGFLNTFCGMYEHALMRAIRRYCNNFYGVSRACGSWLKHFGVKAKGTLYNAANLEVMQQLANCNQSDVREKYGVALSQPLVVFSGRFIIEKGVHEMLQAFTIVLKNIPNAALVMAGDGPLLQKAKEAEPKGVVLPGALAYEDNIQLISCADVFCLPTYSEGFPTAVLEAAALGRCVVTTNVGGCPEIVQNDVSGILLDNLQPEYIATQLQRALKDTAWRTKAGKEGSHIVAENFTWQKTAAKLVSIVKEGAFKDESAGDNTCI